MASQPYRFPATAAVFFLFTVVFLIGRFLSYAYLYATVAAVLYLLDSERIRRPVPASALLLAGLDYLLLYPHTPLNSPLLYSNKHLYGEIADERGFYFYHNSLSASLSAPNKACRPSHPLGIAGCDAAETDERFVMRPAIGLYGYQAVRGAPRPHRPSARPPAGRPRGPRRIGHFKRALPEGYLEHLTQGEPLFTAERLRTIWNLNRGRYDHLLKPYRASRSSGPAPP